LIVAAKSVMKFTEHSATVVTPTSSEEDMLALKVAGFGSLFSAAFILLLYGELLLLNKID